MWDVEGTDEFRDWFQALDDQTAAAVAPAVDILAEEGPALGRPLVDRVVGSAFHNMKELRISAGGRRLRVLFIFDPSSTAVLLLGGDKTGIWDNWYREAIPAADELYRAYLKETKQDGDR
jgi:hypothetical protein